MENLKVNIGFDEFIEITNKLDIRYGFVRSCERVPKSSKMLKLTVEFGDGITDRTILTNIGSLIEPTDIAGLTLPFIINFEPKPIMGIESHGMIVLPQTFGKDPVTGKVDLLSHIPPGTQLF